MTRVACITKKAILGGIDEMFSKSEKKKTEIDEICSKSET